MNFTESLKATWEKNNSLVCVGLDTDPELIPKHLLDNQFPLYQFNKAIVDATADLVCSYKFQIAFYSATGTENQLEMSIDYIRQHYPRIPIILDAKRNDIGNTAKLYAQEAFDRYKVDAVTVNPYLGGDSLEPFLERKNKGVIILCKTSNPGAVDFQDLGVNGTKLYQLVASKAAREWNYNNNVLLVVGATYPNELAEIRTIIGNMPILLPGIGAQGGNLEKSILHGKDTNGVGLLVHSARGIIYAGRGTDFAEAARSATEKLKLEINRYR